MDLDILVRTAGAVSAVDAARAASSLPGAEIPTVTVTGEWIIGSLVTLVGAVLAFVSRLVLQRLMEVKKELRDIRKETQDRLRTLGHEDRQIRQELHETRMQVEENSSKTMDAITTSLKLMSRVYARRGAVEREALKDEVDYIHEREERNYRP